MFGFNDLIHEDLRENSAQAVGEVFSRRYNVRNVCRSYGNHYTVTTRDGHRMDVTVGTRTTLFGEERPFITYISD